MINITVVIIIIINIIIITIFIIIIISMGWEDAAAAAAVRRDGVGAAATRFPSRVLQLPLLPPVVCLPAAATRPGHVAT